MPSQGIAGGSQFRSTIRNPLDGITIFRGRSVRDLVHPSGRRTDASGKGGQITLTRYLRIPERTEIVAAHSTGVRQCDRVVEVGAVGLRGQDRTSIFPE
jgi:hypothetical protein